MTPVESWRVLHRDVVPAGKRKANAQLVLRDEFRIDADRKRVRTRIAGGPHLDRDAAESEATCDDARPQIQGLLRLLHILGHEWRTVVLHPFERELPERLIAW